MNVEKICRTCATKKATKYYNIFTPDEKQRATMVSIIVELVKWQVLDNNDKMPEYICEICYLSFYIYFDFKCECLKAQEKLLKDTKKQQQPIELLNNDKNKNVKAKLKTSKTNEKVKQLEKAQGSSINKKLELDNDSVIKPQNNFTNEPSKKFKNAPQINTKNKQFNNAFIERQDNDEKKALLHKSKIEPHINYITDSFCDIVFESEEEFCDIVFESEEEFACETPNNLAIERLSNLVMEPHDNFHNETACNTNKEAAENLAEQQMESEEEFACETPENLAIERLSSLVVEPHGNFPNETACNTDKEAAENLAEQQMESEEEFAYETLENLAIEPLSSLVMEPHDNFPNDTACNTDKEAAENLAEAQMEAHSPAHSSTSNYSLLSLKSDWQAVKHTSFKPNRYKCQYCCTLDGGDFMYFESVSLLNEHIKATHFDKRPYKCHLCNKGFTTKPSLNQHVNSSHKRAIVVCEICGESIRKLYMPRHIKHHEIGNYCCTICGEKFQNISKFQFENHQKWHNAKYKCSQCSRQFVHQAHLKEHLGEHSDIVKKYACHMCPKKYVYAYRLKNHISATHEGKKLFKCNFCVETFGNYKSKLHHMRLLHNYDRSLKKRMQFSLCKVCGQRCYYDTHKCAGKAEVTHEAAFQNHLKKRKTSNDENNICVD